MTTIKATTETTTVHAFAAGDVSIEFRTRTRDDERATIPDLVTLTYRIDNATATVQIPPAVLERAAGIMAMARHVAASDYSYVCELHGYHRLSTCPECAVTRAPAEAANGGAA